jgi:3D (Asp-Asp-Asp) domain-containing protein
MLKKFWVIFCILLISVGCKKNEDKFQSGYIWDSKYVTATAYNSLVYQTDSSPHITAFGDSLKPGLKYIAVSMDLLKLGLKHNTPVKIDGLEGIYLVKDKMNSRWKNKIDIYMGENVNAAKEWGIKRVCIDFGNPIKKK